MYGVTSIVDLALIMAPFFLTVQQSPSRPLGQHYAWGDRQSDGRLQSISQRLGELGTVGGRHGGGGDHHGTVCVWLPHSYWRVVCERHRWDDRSCGSSLRLPRPTYRPVAPSLSSVCA